MPKSVRTKVFSSLPTHVAIVPDGNGRWAERRGMPRLLGHQAGAETTRRLIGYLLEYPIKYVTLYGFSTENWNRPTEEVQGLFQLTEEHLNRIVPELNQKGIRIYHLGRLHGLPSSLQNSITGAVELTKDNNRMVLSLAFNYGGRAEIVDAVQRLLVEHARPETVNENLFAEYLYTAGIPDVDLLVRTGDELRSSNFLIWQTAYSEYYFTKVLWPDFSRKDMDKALLSYSQRQRRFGGL